MASALRILATVRQICRSSAFGLFTEKFFQPFPKIVLIE